MSDSCMHDPFAQCFHDCDNCPRADKPEPDWDLIRDIERDERYAACRPKNP